MLIPPPVDLIPQFCEKCVDIIPVWSVDVILVVAIPFFNLILGNMISMSCLFEECRQQNLLKAHVS